MVAKNSKDSELGISTKDPTQTVEPQNFIGRLKSKWGLQNSFEVALPYLFFLKLKAEG